MRFLAAFFVCLISLQAFNPAYGADDPFFELRRRMAKVMRKDLEADIKKYLKDTLGGGKEHPFMAKVKIKLAQEERGSANAVASWFERKGGTDGLISRVAVDIHLGFAPPTTDFDLALKQHLRKYFRGKGLDLTARGPFASASLALNISYAPEDYSLIGEFRKNAIYAAMAAMIFFIGFALLSRPRRRAVVAAKPVATQSSEVLAQDPSLFEERDELEKLADLFVRQEVLKQPALNIIPAYPQRRKHPTKMYQALYANAMMAPVDPLKGSWYLHAIPHVPTLQLQRAFQSMPFEEAVLLLRSFRKPYRDDIVRRLDLMPAIQNTLEQAIDSH